MAVPERLEVVRPAAAPPAARLGLGAVAIAVAVVSLLAALAGGWLLRGAAEPPVRVAAPVAAALGTVSLTLDGAWTPAEPVSGLRGLPEDSQVFAPAAGLRARVITALAPAEHPSLLPPALVSALPADLPRPQPARLAGLPAWHYGEQQIDGGRLMEVTVAPTSAGVLAVACVAGVRDWLVAQGCAGGVLAVDGGGARALEPAAAIALRASAPAAIAALDARRDTLRSRLRSATTRRGQARISKRLARAYERTAARLAPVAPSSGRGAAVVPRLRRSAAAYRRMGVAARRNAPRAFRRAGRRAGRSDAALNRALARLGG